MKHKTVLIQVLLLALSLCALVSAQAGSSFLQRFPKQTTDALGKDLNAFFKRLTDSFSRPTTNTVKDPETPTTPLTSTNPQGLTALPEKPEPGTVPKYRTFIQSPKRPKSSMIILHGMDSSARQLQLVSKLLAIELPSTRFVIAQAPKVPVTYLKRTATSWFNIFERKPGFENATELRAAAAGVARLVKIENDSQNLAPEKIVVVGLSQGGALALMFYLAEEIRVGGIIAASTWLPLPSLWKPNLASLPSANEKTPLFMIHGNKDRSIPVEEATRSAAIIRSLGRRVTYKIYPNAGHTLFRRLEAVLPDIITEFKTMVR